MTKKVTIIAACIFMLTATVLFPQARGRNRHKSGDMMKHSRFGVRMAEKNLFPAGMILRFQDKLGLTQKQISTIEGMQQAAKEAAIRSKAETKIQELKLRTYLKKDKIDRKKMEKMIRSIANMKTNMKIDHMNYLLDVKGVLTVDQIQKIEEFKKKRRNNFIKRRGKRGKRQFRQKTPGNQGSQEAATVPQDAEAKTYSL